MLKCSTRPAIARICGGGGGVAGMGRGRGDVGAAVHRQIFADGSMRWEGGGHGQRFQRGDWVLARELSFSRALEPTLKIPCARWLNIQHADFFFTMRWIIAHLLESRFTLRRAKSAVFFAYSTPVEDALRKKINRITTGST